MSGTAERLERAAKAARVEWAGDRVKPWEDLAESTKKVYRALAEATVKAYNAVG